MVLEASNCAPEDQRQNTSGDGIERAQVPNLFEARNAAEARDHIVRSPAGRFVDYDDTVHGNNGTTLFMLLIILPHSRTAARPEPAHRLPR